MKEYVILAGILLATPVTLAWGTEALRSNNASKSPAAGEQVRWQVVAAGGASSSSASYAISGTFGQTAVTRVSSTNYATGQGFWQKLSCCTGTTGNVDGSADGVVDISDVFAMVDYLSSSIPLSNCAATNDVNKDGTVDIGDLFAIIDFLNGAAPLPSCP